jgi:hypothetical protein
MTAENLAKHRLDPNIAFWKELKVGADHFEVTKTEPPVGVCGKHYVFGAKETGLNATEPCPTLHRDEDVEAEVAAKQQHDDEAVAQLVAQGVKPIELVYEDGGQNAAFAGRNLDVSAPEALAAGPHEVALDDKTGKPAPAVVKVAETSQAQHIGATTSTANSTQVAQAPASAQPPAAAAPSPLAVVGSAADSSQSLVKKWLSFGSDSDPNVVQGFEPAQPEPADVPLPPRRNAATDGGAKPQAALHKPTDAKVALAAPQQQ